MSTMFTHGHSVAITGASAHASRGRLLPARRPYGFTLIEMALVLIASVMLMGASLKGQQLINMVKEKQLESDFSRIPMMIYGYLDKYKALPGDDLHAASRFSHLSAVARNGDGEGLILGRWFDTNPANDNAIIWQHLRLAGLMDGTVDPSSPSYIPQNAIGKPIDLQSGTGDANLSPIKDSSGQALKGSYILCSRGIPGPLALSLDIRLDDGNPGQGKMLATPETGEFAPGAIPATIGTQSSSDISPEKQYIVCMGV
jgi:hypothetical protein